MVVWGAILGGGGQEEEAHRNDYMRAFDATYGAWFWAHPDGRPVVDAQSGQMAWDTRVLWL